MILIGSDSCEALLGTISMSYLMFVIACIERELSLETFGNNWGSVGEAR